MNQCRDSDPLISKICRLATKGSNTACGFEKYGLTHLCIRTNAEGKNKKKTASSRLFC